jgi:hypothetical protein
VSTSSFDVFTDVNGNWSSSVQPGEVFYNIQVFGDATGDFSDNASVTEGDNFAIVVIESDKTTATGSTAGATTENATSTAVKYQLQEPG